MRNVPDELMLFAAGFGTRMQPLTDKTPKPLIEVAGQTLLDRTLDLALEGGIKKIAVNTHYLGSAIEKHLKDSSVDIFHEQNILDTGGGLKNASSAFNGSTVFTSNSDAIWSGENPFLFLAKHWEDDCDALLLCAQISNIHGREKPGDFDLSENGTINRAGNLVYLGIQIIRLSLVDEVSESVFSLNLIWDTLIERNRLKVATYSGQWCDVGRPENIVFGEQLLERKIV
jgi:MurNAc alpha-1-phosphate uridylyltransferase